MANQKILLIDDNYHSPERGAFLNRYEYAFLLEHGYDVYSLSFPAEKPEGAGAKDFFFSWPSFRVRQKWFKFMGSGAIRDFVSECIRRVRPDLIHCHLLSRCPASVYEAIDGDIPVIQSLHGPNFFCSTSWGCYPDSGPCELGIGVKCFVRGCVPLSHALLYMNQRRRLWQNMAEKVDVFHCPSRHIRDSALRLGLTRVEQVSYGINERFMRVDREKPTGAPTAIFVGSLAKCKGVDVLIEAMRRVRACVPDARLLIAGNGPMREALVRQVRTAELEGCVRFLGRVSHEVLLEEYRTADVAVVPSVWQEQFGLVGPEALACGLPCVGSDIGGIREWLRHEEWGMLTPPGNAEYLAGAMVYYLTNREDAFHQGLKGRKYARERFDPAVYRANIIGLIERMLHARK